MCMLEKGRELIDFEWFVRRSIKVCMLQMKTCKYYCHVAVKSSTRTIPTGEKFNGHFQKPLISESCSIVSFLKSFVFKVEIFP